jgi:hypothetical protein
VLFALLVLARREHYFAQAEQKSLKIPSLRGQRFWEERILVLPRHKVQVILADYRAF